MRFGPAPGIELVRPCLDILIQVVFVKMVQWKFGVHVGSLPLLILFSSTTVSSDMLKLGFDSVEN